jgi:hypothetical protein
MAPKLNRKDAIKHYTEEIKNASGYKRAADIFLRAKMNLSLTNDDISTLQGLMLLKRDNPFKKPGGEFK